MPIPEGWEVCEPQKSTMAWLSLAGDKLPVALNLDHDKTVRVNGDWISEQSWNCLGIIPIRRIPTPTKTTLLEQENAALKSRIEELENSLAQAVGEIGF